MVAVGMQETSAANLGEKENSTAITAARRITAGIVDLGQGQNAGVFAISGVGRRAEDGAAREVAKPSPSRVRCRPGS